MATFIATHGVQFGEPVWAAFARDEAHDTAEGELRYSLTTDDPQVIARLRKLKADEHGIAEVK